MNYHLQTKTNSLKVFVYMMGITLMGCAAFLTYVVYKRNQQVFKEFSVNDSLCRGGEIELNISQEIISVSREDGLILMLTKSDGRNQQVLLLDYCNNQLISNVKLNIQKSIGDSETGGLEGSGAMLIEPENTFNTG